MLYVCNDSSAKIKFSSIFLIMNAHYTLSMFFVHLLIYHVIFLFYPAHMVNTLIGFLM